MFFKKYGKRIVIGLVAVIIIVIGLVAFRVINFIGDVQATRVSDGVTTQAASQSMAQLTATAQAKLCAASASCSVSPGTVLPGITQVAAMTPTAAAATIAPTATP